MPFRKSAEVELVYEGPSEPGDKLWSMMPCYSYVMWRTADRSPADAGYFHASGGRRPCSPARRDYLALRGQGPGQVHRLERDRPAARLAPATPWT